MNYHISFLPEIGNDVLKGYRWYENRAAGLGEEFLRLFYSLANELPRNPVIYQKVYKNFRRCLLKRFPYAIYYIVLEEQIVVYALFHTARKPFTIKKNLHTRDSNQKNPVDRK